MKVYTHINLDLDAVASLWAAREFIPGARDAEVVFVPADWDGAEMEPGDLALDIRAGGRGIKGEPRDDGRIGSCLAQLVASYAGEGDREVLDHLVIFVESQDATGDAVRLVGNGAGKFGLDVLDAVSVNSVLRALQATHPRDDALVASRMAEILSGMLENGRSRRRAEAEAKRGTGRQRPGRDRARQEGDRD